MRASVAKTLFYAFLCQLPLPDVAFAVAEPAGHRHLLLGEELHAFLALHVQIPKEGFAPAVERVDRFWNSSRHDGMPLGEFALQHRSNLNVLIQFFPPQGASANGQSHFGK